MTEQETYTYGSSYETFIRRAFNCDRGKHGAENAYFKFLLMSDIGKNYLSKPYEKQFSEVKNYLIKAVDKFLTRKPTETELNHLQKIKMDIANAYNATTLVPVIESGLNITKRCRNI